MKRWAATPEGRRQLSRAGKAGGKAACAAMRRNSRLGIPSSLEKVVMRFLDAMGVKYVYQKKIGKLRVDFARKDKRVVYEVDSDHWHSLPGRRDRDAYLRAKGYKIVRVSESKVRELAARLTGGGVVH